MRYVMFFKSVRTVCPKCGGQTKQLNSDEIILRCIDCNTFYKAVDYGQAEAELEFEEVQVGSDVL